MAWAIERDRPQENQHAVGIDLSNGFQQLVTCSNFSIQIAMSLENENSSSPLCISLDVPPT